MRATCPGLAWGQLLPCPTTHSSLLGEVLCLLQKRTPRRTSPHPTPSPKGPNFRGGELLRRGRLLGCWLCCTSPRPTAAVSVLAAPSSLWCQLLTPRRVLLLHGEPRGRARSSLRRDGLPGPPPWRDGGECLVEDSPWKRLCLALWVGFPHFGTPWRTLLPASRTLQVVDSFSL